MRRDIIGIDIAKHIFHIYISDWKGKKILSKRIGRKQVLKFFKVQSEAIVGMEACGGANYWARELLKLGHEVRLISPQKVKPYVGRQKNDENDARAIAEAVRHPEMRFVPIKGIRHQDIQSIHRVRSRLVKQRTALSNEIRGLLLEYGVVISKGHSHLVRQSLECLERASEEVSEMMRGLLRELLEEFAELAERIKVYDRRLEQVSRQEEVCERLKKVPGIGVITATALYAQLSDPRVYRNGREYAASLGLVPKQHSTGGKTKLLGISKQGDGYLRCLLVHGARSVVRTAKHREKPDRLRRWVSKKEALRGHNRACVALANKTARIVWAMVAKGETYKALEAA